MNPAPVRDHALSLGYSPCPNDTFIFYGLVHGLVDTGPVRFRDPVLADVEQLNQWAMDGRLDVTKLSFHALGHVLDRYVLLSAGAALGRGCGPILISRDPGFTPGPSSRVAIPGCWTTAALLLHLYAPGIGATEVMRFDRIMDAVRQGRVDGGVIIHESRFTYQDLGLHCIRDLGNWWEEETGLPIPLGCIAARADLEQGTLRAVDDAIRASLEWIRAHPGQGQDYIHAHAQEMDDQVLASHIGLYVNDFSLRLGREGLAAARELLRRGRAAGVFPEGPGLQWIE